MNGDLSDLSPPEALPDCQDAVARIKAAISAQEKIRIFGDYDCDGICGTVLLVTLLRRRGASVDYRLPSRLLEGYGLNERVIEEAVRDDIRLLITVDCGVTAFEEVARANEAGISVIITDHHEPQAGLPDALAILNPKRADSDYPFRDLGGVAVAYQLARALSGEDLRRDLDLVALGLIADVVPMVGENRILARAGLNVMQRAPRQGFRSLFEKLEMDASQVDGDALAFQVAPRINAPGRLGEAQAMAELMLSTDQGRTDERAFEALEANDRRRDLQKQVVTSVQNRLDEDPMTAARSCIVMGNPDWHVGVLGPAASSLAEALRRPVILLGGDPQRDEGLKGSGRSVGHYSLFKALNSASDFVDAFGGHAQAVGLSLPKEHLFEFAETMHEDAKRHLRADDVLVPLDIASVVRLAWIDKCSVYEIEKMGPFGPENPRPLFMAEDVSIARARPVGKGQEHLLLELANCGLRAIGFGLSEQWVSLLKPNRVDLVFVPEINRWRGRDRVQLRIIDLRVANGRFNGQAVAQLRRRWRRLHDLYPSSDMLKALYQYLFDESTAKMIEYKGADWEALCRRFDCSASGLRVALNIYSELGLLGLMHQGERPVWIKLSDAETEPDWDQAPTYRQGQRLRQRVRQAAEAVDSLSPKALVTALYGFELASEEPMEGGAADES